MRDRLPTGPTGKPTEWNGWRLRALVSAIAIGLLVWRADGTLLVQMLGDVRWDFCLGAVGVYVIAQFLSAYRWQLLAQPLGFDLSFFRFLAISYVGMFFNLFLPTSMGGDVVRLWCLSPQPGRRLLAALSIFSERLSGLLALLFIASLAALIQTAVYPAWVLATVWGMSAAGTAGLIGLPMLGRWHPKFRQLAESLSFCRGHWRRWLAALGLSFAVQWLAVFQLWLLSQALGLPSTLAQYAVVCPVVILLTMLPISVNGVGVREGSLILLLAPFGVTEAQAVALGIVWFGSLTVGSLFGGGVYLFSHFGRPKVATPSPIRIGPDQGRKEKSAAA